MKKVTVLLAVILCMFALTGCKKSVIEGKWLDASGTTYTFNSDMTYAINVSADVVVGGSFSILKDANKKDTNQIVFTLNVPSGQPIVSQATFTIDSNAKMLTFVGTDGTTTLLHQ